LAEDDATVHFDAWLTPTEAEALKAVIARWAEDMRASGLPERSDPTSWFRALVRNEALARGVAVGGQMMNRNGASSGPA
jgi:hypothetical protein